MFGYRWEKQLALVHLVQNALHVIVADPGARKGGKRNFLIDDPADGGAMDEVADLEMQRKITLVTSASLLKQHSSKLYCSR